MPCLLTKSRAEVCKEFVGGIKSIYFINYNDNPTNTPLVPTYSVTAGQEDSIATITGATNLYKYDLKGANSFEQTITSSRENGTTFVEQTLTFTIKGLDAIATKQMKLLAWGRPQVVIRTNANNFFIAGLFNGMDVTTGTISNGTAMGDLNGYTMTLVGQENIPANHLNVAQTLSNPSTDAQLLAVFTGATIVAY